MQRDLYQEVTDKMITSLERGVVPWVKPWNAKAGLPRNGVSGRAYSGINVPLLWMTASDNSYASQEWYTYDQAQALGGQVRRGEKGTTITFWRQFSAEDKATKKEKMVPFLRHYSVFNREQIDGLPELVTVAVPSEVERNDAAEQFIRQSGALVLEGGSEAYYDPNIDVIHLPPSTTNNNPKALVPFPVAPSKQTGAVLRECLASLVQNVSANKYSLVDPVARTALYL